MKKFLPMHLQFFAAQEEQEQDDQQTNEANTDENITEGVPGEDQQQQTAESKGFTQEDVDRIVKERLERERKKREEAIQKERDEAERKRLAENEEYKELADKLQAQLDAMQEETVKAKKDALLIAAGYTTDQIEKYGKYVEGSTEEELKQSVEALKADIPPKPKYADPGVGNGQKQEPKKKSLEDTGRTMYQRLKAKGKIRR